MKSGKRNLLNFVVLRPAPPLQQLQVSVTVGLGSGDVHLSWRMLFFLKKNEVF
jgi:hypothetical protein